VSDQLKFFCKDEQQRRADLLAHPNALLNGIDFLEVDAADHRTLRVFFLRPVAPANAANPNDPADVYGLRADPSRVLITGGTRIIGIRVVEVVRAPDGHLDIKVDPAGDFSVYELTLNAPNLDPFLSSVEFSFMASCPVDFDCLQPVECPPPALSEPLLDYLAKDYASFRRLMLDLLPQLNPNFIERNPSDLGIALIELLAYHGDHLSYAQDAVGNEAYLDTARHRISARRHARLIDYRMHDGRNAWTYVHVAVTATGTLDIATKMLTKISSPLGRNTAPPGVVIDESKITADSLERDPALSSTVVFESTHKAGLAPQNNEVFIHTWGNEECCLRRGTTEVFLYSVNPATHVAELPVLKRGDLLLFEEVKGPLTGAAADANLVNRQVVLIDEIVSGTTDPLYKDVLTSDNALQRFQAGDTPLPLLRVRWLRDDALGFPLCISARLPDIGKVRNISVARGNIILADHGLSISETILLPSPAPADEIVQIELSRGPLTKYCLPAEVEYDLATGQLKTERRYLACDVRETTPAVSLRVSSPSLSTELWTVVPDLLDSSAFDQNFVAEVDNSGRASLRFGDGEYGREVSGATRFDAVYRIGNGVRGNIGLDSLAHVALSGPANWIDSVRNPLAAVGGVDAEPIGEVRQKAPQAFHAEQFRAVTEADYVNAAKKMTDVAGAVASFRWTGSWYTVFVGVDPRDQQDLIFESGGRIRLSPRLERRVRAFLTRYRLAGYDMEIRPPQFVPLEIEIEICVTPGYFRGDVKRVVAEALSSRILSDGSRGFFHPDNFTFGQAVYLSQIYAAVERVEGVESAVIRIFKRYGQSESGELESGVMTIGPWEIAQLENDPDFMEHGVLTINALGGKA
jgi:Baseplate J-like protein